jgi:hypothetical protein
MTMTMRIPTLPNVEPQEPYPLPCLNLITLITYQFSLLLLLFVCLACPWACLHLRTLALTTFAARVLAYQQFCHKV